MRNYLLVVMSVILFASCSDDNQKEILLNTSPALLSFTANAETKSFDIEANDLWIIENAPSWCKLDNQKGENSKTISVTVEANPLEENREATLKITSHDKKAEVRITQNAKNIELELSVNELNFNEIQEEKGIAIISNDKWTVADTVEWFTLNKNEGSGNDSLYITVDELYVDTLREAILKIESGSKSQLLKITQTGKEIVLDISYPAFEYYAEGGTRAIEIISNVKWSMHYNDNDTWFDLDKTESSEKAILTVTAKENKTPEYRRSEIKIKAGNIERTIYVKQDKFVAVSSDPYQFNYRDHSMRIGDKYVKNQVEYVNEGPSGQNIVWDFSKLTVVNSNYDVEYTPAPFISHDYYGNYTEELKLSPDGIYIMGYDLFLVKETQANSLIVKTEHNTMYYFQLGEDNLLHALGHENRVTKLKYEPDMIMGQYPTYYNDNYKFAYESNGKYSGTEPINFKGDVEMKADAYGKILFPNGITVDNVIRVSFAQLIIDKIRNENMEIVEIQNSLITTQWYAKGYRYPIFESIRNISHKDDGSDQLIFATSFYFPPSMHYQYMNKRKSSSVEIIDNNKLLEKYEKYRFKN